jgi:Protein of unknown function (DUF559)
MTNTRARDLRKHMRDAERRLWRGLRIRQVDDAHFRRQHPIGAYIASRLCTHNKAEPAASCRRRHHMVSACALRATGPGYHAAAD